MKTGYRGECRDCDATSGTTGNTAVTADKDAVDQWVKDHKSAFETHHRAKAVKFDNYNIEEP